MNLNRLTESITMVFVIAMVCLIFLQIMTRLLFNTSFVWTDELARYLMIAIIFLGASLAFQYGSHISIDLLSNRLSNPSKKIFQTVVAMLCIIFLIVIIIKGFELVSLTLGQRSPNLRIPMGYIYSVIPLAGILQILNIIDVTIKFWKNGEIQEE
ncbi:TRAP transporter small permease [Alkalihalobacterium alkalinitrilicum]|uniref:TRAP transporter small permease n=1 Tax=Alkalihalobacterium alkalinitrilicum TaxID=427920 RepID=UPI0013031869|nr:TRAP transporter small permease [Alkalihalobacterium alkalinitrilicum]